jgi:conjugative relaxase-like TrwC/TraI family protein
MLSIRSMSGTGVGDYYLDLAREDYYLSGGEPPGMWLGSGAKSLKLTGQVTREELRAILSGFSPKDGAALAQNAGRTTRHSGWDLTFSAPKSVSILWGLSDKETRSEIEKAHREAVEEILGILEREQIETRRGKGGAQFERASLVAAAFEHSTSRALDPQLHTHVLVSNVGEREDGTWGTIVGRPLFENKMALGALYRAELTKRLSETFHISWARTQNLIEATVVKKGLLELFAKRRAQIEELLSIRGESGARASEFAALSSRKDKNLVSRPELFSSWATEALSFGFTLPILKRRAASDAPKVVRDEIELANDRADSLFRGVSQLLEFQSYFSEWEIIRKAAETSMGEGVSAEEVLHIARTFLATNSGMLFLGKDQLKKLYTSKEMYEAEEALLNSFGENAASQNLAPATLQTISEREGFNAEQSEALERIAEGRPLTIISGMAGTGKSNVLKGALTLLKEAGLDVLGAAPTGKVSEDLELKTGIRSMTLHKLLLEIENENVVFTKKSVLIVDEAGMVGTLFLKKVSDEVIKKGGRLILIGDEKQLQPISAGGPFGALLRKFGGAFLTKIRRQRRYWDRERIFEFVNGEASKAFSKYFQQGKLQIGSDKGDTLKLLIASWKESGGLLKPEENLILASENMKVRELNVAAQYLRKINALLGAVYLESQGQKFFEGDRVVFTRNSKNLGVKNGSFGTIKEIRQKEGRLIVLLDSGKRVSAKLFDYPHVRLGYAVTTHKAQGITAENAFVLLGGGLQDREISYVQASRARGETKFFVSKDEAGEKLKRISFVASQSHQKKLAVEVGIK